MLCHEPPWQGSCFLILSVVDFYRTLFFVSVDRGQRPLRVSVRMTEACGSGGSPTPGGLPAVAGPRELCYDPADVMAHYVSGEGVQVCYSWPYSTRLGK